jgi:hypothetical protein
MMAVFWPDLGKCSFVTGITFFEATRLYCAESWARPGRAIAPSEARAGQNKPRSPKLHTPSSTLHRASRVSFLRLARACGRTNVNPRSQWRGRPARAALTAGQRVLSTALPRAVSGPKRALAISTRLGFRFCSRTTARTRKLLAEDNKTHTHERLNQPRRRRRGNVRKNERVGARIVHLSRVLGEIQSRDDRAFAF